MLDVVFHKLHLALRHPPLLPLLPSSKEKLQYSNFNYAVKFACYVTYEKTQDLDVLAALTCRPSKTDNTSHLFGELKKKPRRTKRSDASSVDGPGKLFCASKKPLFKHCFHVPICKKNPQEKTCKKNVKKVLFVLLAFLSSPLLCPLTSSSSRSTTKPPPPSDALRKSAVYYYYANNNLCRNLLFLSANIVDGSGLIMEGLIQK